MFSFISYTIQATCKAGLMLLSVTLVKDDPTPECRKI